ncbi:MAG: methyl-accepting chemotaxis protein, partial [Gammaproteobacteria bacterium]
LESAVTQAVTAMHEGQEKARSTVDQAASAGESLHQINSIVSAICDINLQIASSAEEQRTFSEKMLGHVHDSDKMTEKSADSSKKLSYASEKLQNLAQGLQEVTGQFKI